IAGREQDRGRPDHCRSPVLQPLGSPHEGRDLIITPPMSSEPRSVKFTVYQPNLAPARLALPMETITLGRASDCTIPIRDRFLSRRHAEILYLTGQWVVRDCGSVNGTLLNGEK